MIDEFTAEDLEARCKSSLMIQVDRIPEACSILENVVGTKKLYRKSGWHHFPF